MSTPMFRFLCPRCNLEFERSFASSSDHRRFKGFCSRKCANSRIWNSEVNLQRSKKSKAYQAAISDEERKQIIIKIQQNRKPTPRKGRTTLPCPICGTLFEDYRSGKRVKTCSKKCGSIQSHSLHKRKHTPELETWFEVGTLNTSLRFLTVRLFLLEKVGKACQDCGWQEANPTNGIVYIHIDHVDGDPTNNRRINLRVLCPNCHTLTPTYTGLNGGRGRKSRRKGLVLDPNAGMGESVDPVVPNTTA